MKTLIFAVSFNKTLNKTLIMYEEVQWINPFSGRKCVVGGMVYRDKEPVTAFITSYVSISKQTGQRMLLNVDVFQPSLIKLMQRVLIESDTLVTKLKTNDKTGTSTE